MASQRLAYYKQVTLHAESNDEESLGIDLLYGQLLSDTVLCMESGSGWRIRQGVPRGFNNAHEVSAGCLKRLAERQLGPHTCR